MRTLAVLPSRFQASRFPGKPLALIAGKPMIQWVFEAAHRARGVDRVVVATDDDRIATAVNGFGGEAVTLRLVGGGADSGPPARVVGGVFHQPQAADHPLGQSPALQQAILGRPCIPTPWRPWSP